MLGHYIVEAKIQQGTEDWVTQVFVAISSGSVTYDSGGIQSLNEQVGLNLRRDGGYRGEVRGVGAVAGVGFASRLAETNGGYGEPEETRGNDVNVVNVKTAFDVFMRLAKDAAIRTKGPKFLEVLECLV